MQQKICSHEAHVVAMTKQLQNSTAREVDKFAALPLGQVHYSGVDRRVMSGYRQTEPQIFVLAGQNFSNSPLKKAGGKKYKKFPESNI